MNHQLVLNPDGYLEPAITMSFDKAAADLEFDVGIAIEADQAHRLRAEGRQQLTVDMTQSVRQPIQIPDYSTRLLPHYHSTQSVYARQVGRIKSQVVRANAGRQPELQIQHAVCRIDWL